MKEGLFDDSYFQQKRIDYNAFRPTVISHSICANICQYPVSHKVQYTCSFGWPLSRNSFYQQRCLSSHRNLCKGFRLRQCQSGDSNGFLRFQIPNYQTGSRHLYTFLGISCAYSPALPKRKPELLTIEYTDIRNGAYRY